MYTTISYMRSSFEFSHSLSLDQTQLSSSSSDSRMGRRTWGPSGSIQFMALVHGSLKFIVSNIVIVSPSPPPRDSKIVSGLTPG